LVTYVQNNANVARLTFSVFRRRGEKRKKEGVGERQEGIQKGWKRKEREEKEEREWET